MCTYSTNSEKVNVLGYFDLTITILTIVVIVYGVILPYWPYRAVESNTSEPENLEPLNTFPFWFAVTFFGTLGLIGILWSLVLIKTSGLQGNRVKERYQMLGYWLMCNSFIALILTYLWIIVVVIGANVHDHIFNKAAVQLSYGSCCLFRIILIFLVWRERRKFPDERGITEKYDRQRMAQIENDRKWHATFGRRGRFYFRTVAKEMFHGKHLELKPYRGGGLMANCECVAPKVNE